VGGEEEEEGVEEVVGKKDLVENRCLSRKMEYLMYRSHQGVGGHGDVVSRYAIFSESKDPKIQGSIRRPKA